MKRYIAIYLCMFSTIAFAVKITKITWYQVEKKDQPKINSCPYLAYQSKFKVNYNNKNSSTPERRELRIQQASEQNKISSREIFFYIGIAECMQTNKEFIPNVNFDIDYINPKLNSDKLMLEACTDLVAFYN